MSKVVTWSSRWSRGVQDGHVEFTHALPRRNFGQYVEEELVQQSFAGPLSVGEDAKEWLRAMIFLFDARVCLVHLEMEQVFCEHMLCIRLHSMLCSVQAITEEQGESSLCQLPHLSQNRCSAVPEQTPPRSP